MPEATLLQNWLDGHSAGLSSQRSVESEPTASDCRVVWRQNFGLRYIGRHMEFEGPPFLPLVDSGSPARQIPYKRAKYR